MRPRWTASGSDAHRHHDREKLPRAGRLYDSGIELAAEPEHALVFVESAQHVEEVLGVEAYRHVGARVLDGNLVGALAAVGRLRGDPHRALGEPQLDAARTLARGDGHGTESLRELRARDAHELLALLRDHLRVRGELRVDEANRERHPGRLEERARAALRDLELGLRLPLFGLAAEVF